MTHCCICREKLPAAGRTNANRAKLPCGHDELHATCLLQWLARVNTCPLCRAAVLPVTTLSTVVYTRPHTELLASWVTWSISRLFYAAFMFGFPLASLYFLFSEAQAHGLVHVALSTLARVGLVFGGISAWTFFTGQH